MANRVLGALGGVAELGRGCLVHTLLPGTGNVFVVWMCCLLVPFFGSVKPPKPVWCMKNALALCDDPWTGKEML